MARGNQTMKLIDPQDLQLVSLTQAAKISALSRRHFQRLVSEKVIPVIDLNKGRPGAALPCLRIRLKDLQAFIEKRIRNPKG